MASPAPNLPDTAPEEHVWRTSRVLRVLLGVAFLGLAVVAADVLRGIAHDGATTEDVLVLGCLLVMGALGGVPVLRPYCRLTADELRVRNFGRTWHLPLAQVASAGVGETGPAQITDREGRTRLVAVASCHLLEALVGVDQRTELLDALAARGVTVQRR